MKIYFFKIKSRTIFQNSGKCQSNFACSHTTVNAIETIANINKNIFVISSVIATGDEGCEVGMLSCFEHFHYTLLILYVRSNFCFKITENIFYLGIEVRL